MKPKSITLILSLLFSVLSFPNLSAQALVGAWYTGDTSASDSDVIVFFGNGYYMHMSDDSTGGAFTGYERGTYTWSGVNGSSFTATAITDTNNDNGLSAIDNGSATLSISGNTLTADDFDGPDTNPFNLTRVTSANDIVGAWFEGDITATDSSTVGVFMSNLTYFIASDQGTDGGGGLPGIERGTYTWDLATGAFTSNTALNTDGDNGLSGTPLVTNITITSGVLSAYDGSETTTLYSVTAVPEPSTYADAS
jgi:hypothetical protein